MNIEVKDHVKTHTIGKEEFSIDYGDPRVLDAHDGLVKYLNTMDAKNTTATELTTKINECLEVVFGNEQYQRLDEMKATDSTNALVLATLVMKDVREYNAENNIDAILKEFGLV